jgi:3-deoxy-D-manno-octulosonic-acid transferase
VVDSVGSLLSIYAIADAAWVGGGFIAGVHSVVEPAAYGLPLACGPNIDRARDARPLLDAGCLHVCTTPQEAQRWLRDVVMRSDVRSAIGHVGRDYVAARAGSAARLAAIVLDSIDQ